MRFFNLGLLIINELSATGFDAEENIAYEFFTQAMTIYEEEISDSKHKIQVMYECKFLLVQYYIATLC